MVFITLKSYMPNPCPGIRRLAADCGISPTTLIRHLDELEMTGWIIREYRDGTRGETNRYHLFEHPVPPHERRPEIQERLAKSGWEQQISGPVPETGTGVVSKLESRNWNGIDIMPNTDKPNTDKPHTVPKGTGGAQHPQQLQPTNETLDLFERADVDAAANVIPATRREYTCAIIGQAKSLPWAGFYREEGFDLGVYFGKVCRDGIGSGVPSLVDLHRLLESLQGSEEFPRPQANCADPWGWLTERVRVVIESNTADIPPFDYRWADWADRLNLKWEPVMDNG